MARRISVFPMIDERIMTRRKDAWMAMATWERLSVSSSEPIAAFQSATMQHGCLPLTRRRSPSFRCWVQLLKAWSSVCLCDLFLSLHCWCRLECYYVKQNITEKRGLSPQWSCVVLRFRNVYSLSLVEAPAYEHRTANTLFSWRFQGVL